MKTTQELIKERLNEATAKLIDAINLMPFGVERNEIIRIIDRLRVIKGEN